MRGTGWNVFRAILGMSQFLFFEIIQNSGTLRDPTNFPPVLIRKQLG
jgi:hypothetical protein